MSYQNFKQEDWDARREYYIDKKGLRDVKNRTIEKKKIWEDLKKGYGLTEQQLQSGAVPPDAIEAFEDYAKAEIQFSGALKYKLSEDAKGGEESYKSFEEEFTGKQKKELTQAEIEAKIEQAEADYVDYGTQDELTKYVKATIEADGATPEERIDKDDQRSFETMQLGLERLKERARDAEAMTLAEKEMRTIDGIKSKEQMMADAYADKRIMHSTASRKKTRQDPFELEIIERKKEIMKERGYTQEDE